MLSATIFLGTLKVSMHDFGCSLLETEMFQHPVYVSVFYNFFFSHFCFVNQFLITNHIYGLGQTGMSKQCKPRSDAAECSM